MDQKTTSELHARLVEAAKSEDGFIYYREIIETSGIGHLSGDAIVGSLVRVLYEINEYDRQQDPLRPMLSAIAISSEGGPGHGFYTLARQYGKFSGKGDSAELTFWLQELKALRAYWSQQPAGQRQTYLLAWNPGKSEWPGFREDWESVYAGYRPRIEWSCGNTRRIQPGDRVFLMRLGRGSWSVGLTASGWVTRGPSEGEHWMLEDRTTLYVEFEPDVLLNPEIDQLLDPKRVSADFDWFPQRSGITIPDDVADQLEEAWQLHVKGFSVSLEQPASEKNLPSTFVEGARKLVSSYQNERDPRAREACIRHYGTRCVVCGFDFEGEYGPIGLGFIHVHHLTPIAERDSEYTIDPVADLRPVCPNCHAMLHRTSPPLTIEQLQEMRRLAAH